MTNHMRAGAGAIIKENDAILLVGFEDKRGLHYHSLRGGVEPGHCQTVSKGRDICWCRSWATYICLLVCSVSACIRTREDSLYRLYVRM
ncbi:hypothetical protein [Cytobacillus horneckiae]|uniref:hypothetical protein n=1 Tax=Cytobacillus horneckiae TaxID=549687 RepID=UPI00203C4548|nr:hypothetical protein [Cytobacillus horneckiae]MCM3176964.1 hypothetical protein [Cytobacillus horneckiae]